MCVWIYLHNCNHVRLDTVAQAGEVLYLPEGWYHSVMNLDLHTIGIVRQPTVRDTTFRVGLSGERLCVRRCAFAEDARGGGLACTRTVRAGLNTMIVNLLRNRY